MVRQNESANRFDTRLHPVGDPPSPRPGRGLRLPKGHLMHTSARRRRALSASLIALALAGGTTACSDDTGSSGASAGGTFPIWDPYPQYDDTSAWVQLLNKCGTDAGVTVKRTAYDTSDLT